MSVVIPCLNEAESIEACVTAAHDALSDGHYDGEVLVVDNGSTDGSGKLAASAGARVVEEPRRGYGRAYLAGLDAARGRYIVMLDADMTYDAGELPRFVEALDDGGDMAIGNRMKGIQPGAMPWMHQYIGNPVLTGLAQPALRHRGEGRPLRDARGPARCAAPARPAHHRHGAGLRDGDPSREGGPRHPPVPDRVPPAARRVEALDLGGRMEASALPAGAQPDSSLPDPRRRDGVLGTLIIAGVLAHVSFLGHQWDIHALIGGSLMLILGTQVIALGLCALAYGVYFMDERDAWFNRMRAKFKLEHGLLLGGAVIVTGLLLGGVMIGIWIDRGLGSLGEQKLAVVAATLTTVGTEVFFTSFLLSILGLRRPK